VGKDWIQLAQDREGRDNTVLKGRGSGCLDSNCQLFNNDSAA